MLWGPISITTVRSGNPEADGQFLEAEEHRIFRRVAGIARFLRTLRLDIGFAVKELSHRLAAPRVHDFERCKRLCRYLNRTNGLGVFFPRGRGQDPDGFSLVAYSGSDWAGDRESRKSTSSQMIWWGPHLISDLVNGQSVVATSSGEAELYAAVSVMKYMILIKQALSFSRSKWLCCGRNSGSKTEVWQCDLNRREPIVRTWVPRSIHSVARFR